MSSPTKEVTEGGASQSPGRFGYSDKSNRSTGSTASDEKKPVVNLLAPHDIEEPKESDFSNNDRGWFRWFTNYWGPWYNKQKDPAPPFPKK